MVSNAPEFNITLANDSLSEQGTRELLVELLASYPLEKWRYTNEIRISDGETPHSHPILTLNSYPDKHQPIRLLASYIHEQLHWFWVLGSHEDRCEEAWRQFHEAFPGLPVDRPAGCGTERSNYLHIAVNYWELSALTELIGSDAARDYVSRKPFYTAIYGLVLTETDRIQSILETLGLIPPPLPPKDRIFIMPRPLSDQSEA